MDTMKILLGATIALLLGALAVSWQGMNEGVKNAPADEIARLHKEVSELRAETEKLQLEKMQQSQPLVQPAAPSENEVLKAQLAAAEQAARDAADAAADAEARAARDAKLDDSEQLLQDKMGLESKDAELRRARLIRDALLVGKIVEYAEDPEHPELGGFVVLSVIMPEQVQEGTVLAIRRKTGILGQLKVSQVTPDGAIANPMAGFGPVKPVPGDELILPPQY